MKRLILALALSLTASAAFAQDVTKPIRYTWIASSCTSWNTAAAALVVADGDPYVIAIPTGDDQRPWVILRRVEAGSVFIPPEEPFLAELHDTMDGATLQYATLDASRFPMVMSVPGGGAVVVSHRESGGRQRSVRH